MRAGSATVGGSACPSIGGGDWRHACCVVRDSASRATEPADRSRGSCALREPASGVRAAPGCRSASGCGVGHRGPAGVLDALGVEGLLQALAQLALTSYWSAGAS